LASDLGAEVAVAALGSPTDAWANLWVLVCPFQPFLFRAVGNFTVQAGNGSGVVDVDLVRLHNTEGRCVSE
jgi:hypothetical protein